MIESVKPTNYIEQPRPAGTPLDGSIVTRPKPVYEGGPANLPARVYPSVDSGIYRSRTGSWVVDVMVKDPVTSRDILLTGVRLEQASQGIIQKINKDGTVYISIPDQRLIGERDTSTMTAKWLNTNVGTENGAVPLDMLFNNFRNKITSAANRSCAIAKFDYDVEKRLLNKTDGLTVYADETNPKSSGVVFDTTDGKTAIFNQYGENVTLSKTGVSIEGKKFNRGGSNQTKNGLGTLGLPGNENEIQDLLPRSNILLNVPLLTMPYVPDFMQILYGVAFLYKIVRIGIVAGEFISGNDE